MVGLSIVAHTKVAHTAGFKKIKGRQPKPSAYILEDNILLNLYSVNGLISAILLELEKLGSLEVYHISFRSHRIS